MGNIVSDVTSNLGTNELEKAVSFDKNKMLPGH